MNIMKAKYLILCLVLLAFASMPVFAQERQASDPEQAQTTVQPGFDNPDKAAPIDRDPRMSDEEWQLIQHAGEDNPVNAQPIDRDPKMSDAEWKQIQTAGEDNPVNAQPIPDDHLMERRDVNGREIGTAAPVIQRAADDVQPPGDMPANPSVDRNSLKSADAQEAGETPANPSVDRNKMTGPDTQPQGDRDN
jgi:hypothetical protein